MRQFKYTQEVLVSVWQRMKFTIEAESKEEADKIAAQYWNKDVSDDFEVECEYLFETEDMIYPCDEYPVTVEVFDADGKKIVDNG